MFRKLQGLMRFQTFVVAMLLLVGALLFSTPASAHPELVKSDPAADALLGAPPQEINLWYSERVDTGAGYPQLRSSTSRVIAPQSTPTSIPTILTTSSPPVRLTPACSR